MSCRYLYYSALVHVASTGNATLQAEVSCANAFSVFIDGEQVATNYDTGHSRLVGLACVV
jgi:hypothetical protein